MRIAITLEDEKGLGSNVSSHFGQCEYFLIAEIEDGKIKSSEVIPNSAQHGGGNCAAVGEILKNDISHLISGGMGGGAQNKFVQAGVQVFGYSGKAEDAIENFISEKLDGLGACTQQDHHHH